MTLRDASNYSTSILKEEIDTYEDHKDELLLKAKGQFVLIKGKKIIDIFRDKRDAIDQGHRRLGHVPFFVKEIVEVEIPISFPAPIVKG